MPANKCLMGFSALLIATFVSGVDSKQVKNTFSRCSRLLNDDNYFLQITGKKYNVGGDVSIEGNTLTIKGFR